MYSALVGLNDYVYEEVIDFNTNILHRGAANNLISVGPRFRTDLCKNVYVHRIIKIWNKIQVYIKAMINENMESIIASKKEITNYYEKQFWNASILILAVQ